MGNRATLLFVSGEEAGLDKAEPHPIGVYLHWNGGLESVQAFLDYAKDQGCRSGDDWDYGIARLTQIVGNFFCGTLSLGLVNTNPPSKAARKASPHSWLRSWCENNSPGDNGCYVIGQDYKIVAKDARVFVHEPGKTGAIHRMRRPGCLDRLVPLIRESQDYLGVLSGVAERNTEHFQEA